MGEPSPCHLQVVELRGQVHVLGAPVHSSVALGIRRPGPGTAKIQFHTVHSTWSLIPPGLIRYQSLIPVQGPVLGGIQLSVWSQSEWSSPRHRILAPLHVVV